MKLDITFRGMSPSPSIEDVARRWAARLERTYDRIIDGTVVIEVPHRHQSTGQMFHVRIDLTVPDRTLSVSRDPGLDHAHEDPYTAVNDAFRSMRRQLLEYARVRRGEVKRHVA